MTGPLAGMAAMVTGGRRGIGAAIVRGLCEAGADVVFTTSGTPDSTRELVIACQQEFGVRCIAVEADQSDATASTRAVHDARGLLGGLQIVVVNAGVSVWAPIGAPLDDAAIDRQLLVNQIGAIATMREAAVVLPDGGRIIAIGSTAADRVGMRGLADYAATKAALGGFVRGAARDLGARSLTVNLVQPGHVQTDMNPSTRESRELVETQSALGRFGRPEEIAAAVTFLATPSASYITGATINVDGGAGA